MTWCRFLKLTQKCGTKWFLLTFFVSFQSFFSMHFFLENVYSWSDTVCVFPVSLLFKMVFLVVVITQSYTIITILFTFSQMSFPWVLLLLSLYLMINTFVYELVTFLLALIVIRRWLFSKPLCVLMTVAFQISWYHSLSKIKKQNKTNKPTKHLFNM